MITNILLVAIIVILIGILILFVNFRAEIDAKKITHRTDNVLRNIFGIGNKKATIIELDPIEELNQIIQEENV